MKGSSTDKKFFYREWKIGNLDHKNDTKTTEFKTTSHQVIFFI